MPKQRSNVIELNGRRYDATTGQLLSATSSLSIDPIVIEPTKTVKPASSPAKAKPATEPITKKPLIDGFVHQPSKSATQIHVRTKKSVTLKRPAKPAKLTIKVTDLTQAKPKPASPAKVHVIAAHQPVKSPTLMRQAVKKPDIARKPKLAAETHSSHLAKPVPQGLVPKHMSDTVNQQRLERAYRIPQHQKVSRFYEPTRLVAALPVAVPVHVPVTPLPKQLAPAAQPAKPAPIPIATDNFTKAIQAARSHEETYKPVKKPRRTAGRLILSSAVSLALLGVVGGVLYFNRAGIEMQFVAAQAGFNAVLPTYKPAGFNYQGIEHRPGSVSLTYQASTTETRYQLSEQPSSWNSQTLLEAYVSTLQQPYQAKQVGGRTVYLFGDSNATWVSGGVWFQIQTTGGTLTTDQLLKIAASL